MLHQTTKVNDDHGTIPRPPRAPRGSQPHSQVPSAASHFRPIQQPSHFLHGFNVEDCYDVRSIPDPPSPEPRNKRRLSSPMVNMRSLEDVTNQSSASKSNKRSRRSLCHIPSPAMEEERDDMWRQPEVEPRTLQVNICMANDDDEVYSNSKHRKKRQSMELPRELVDKRANIYTNVSPRHHRSHLKRTKSFTGELQSLQELQLLVRRYCSLSKKHQDVSEEVRAIEETTGYPLNNPMSETEGGHPLNYSTQRMAIQKMAPLIEEMDRRKIIETKRWEDVTGCRVGKSKSGKYKYYSISSNTKVSAQEYQSRYMAVLERDAEGRLESANKWMARLLPPPDFLPPAPSRDEAELKRSPTDTSSEMDEDDDSFAVTQELDLDINTILEMPAKYLTASCSSEDDKMDLCDKSVSLDLGETTSLSLEEAFSADEESADSSQKAEQAQSPIKRSISAEHAETRDIDEEMEDDENLCLTITKNEDVMKENVVSEDNPSNGTAEMAYSRETAGSCENDKLSSPRPNVVHKRLVSEEECDGENEEAIQRDDSHSPMQPLLPLPMRNGPSTDPDIARAERKLWNRIDAALHDYSQEIVMIMNSKRAAGGKNKSYE